MPFAGFSLSSNCLLKYALRLRQRPDLLSFFHPERCGYSQVIAGCHFPADGQSHQPVVLSEREALETVIGADAANSLLSRKAVIGAQSSEGPL